MSSSKPKALHITLNPDGVAAPAQRAVVMASNLIGICLRALEKDDLSAPDLRAGAVFYRFDGLELSEQEKRGGVVGPRDVDPGTKILSLHFPRLQLFYMRGSEEVELAMDEPIDTQSEDNPFGKGTGVQIFQACHSKSAILVR